MASKNEIFQLFSQLVDHFLSKNPLYHRHADDSDPDLQLDSVESSEKFTRKLYKDLFKFSYSYAAGINVMSERFSVVDILSVIIYKMRWSGNFHSADNLSICLKKLTAENNRVPEDIQACLRFLIAVSKNTDQEELFLSNPESSESTDAAAEVVNDAESSSASLWYDETSFDNQHRLFLYPRELFEKEEPFVIATPSFSQQQAILEMLPGTDMSECSSFLHTKYQDEKCENQFQELEISQITNSSSLRSIDFSQSSVMDFGGNSSSQRSMITPSEDEGYTELNSPLMCQNSCAMFESSENQLLVWENRGSSSSVDIKDIFLSEEGSEAYDATYQSHEALMMKSQICFRTSSLLANDVVCVLIGLPSKTFWFRKTNQGIKLQPGRRMVGMSLESFEAMISEFIEMGTLFSQLLEFSRGSILSDTTNEGSVSRAFKDGVYRYLMCYKSSVLSACVKPEEPIEALKNMFGGLRENIKAVAELCGITYSSYNNQELPVGAELLTYLYQKCEKYYGQDFYSILLLIMKYTLSPYLRYLKNWLFQGIIDDPFDEFHIQKNFAHERSEDITYWMHCYMPTTSISSDFMPQFFRDIASDVLICGKSLNLMKRCCPEHYVCLVGKYPPDLELGFSEKTILNIQETSQKHIFIMLSIMQEKLKTNVYRAQSHLYETSMFSEQEALNDFKIFSNIKKWVRLSDLKRLVAGNMMFRIWEKLTEEDKHKYCKLLSRNKWKMPNRLENQVEYEQATLSYEKLMLAKRSPLCELLYVLDLKEEDQTENKLLSALPFCHLCQKNKIIELQNRRVKLKNERRKSWPELVVGNSCDDSEISCSGIIFSKCIPAESCPQMQNIYGDVSNSPLWKLKHNICAVADDDDELCVYSRSQSGSKTDDKLVGHLVAHVQKYLLESAVCKEKQDETSFIQWNHLSLLINRSLHPLLRSQIELVNKCTLQYFFFDLQLHEHFLVLRNIFFLYDGDFGHSLSQQLFYSISQCKEPSELLNPLCINSILVLALATTTISDTFTSLFNFNIKSVPIAFPTYVLDVQKYLYLNYKIEWPCNIMITDKHLQAYNSVFTFILQVKRILWLMTDTWFYLTKTVKSSELNDSIQYRKLQIYRHEMQHFASVLQAFIGSQVLQITWDEFQYDLDNNVHNIDQLRNAHANYLQKAITRCFLSRKFIPVMNVIHNLFKIIMQFCSSLKKCEWRLNGINGQWEHPSFHYLNERFKRFKDSSCFIYKVLKEVHAVKYQIPLEDFLVRFDFNRHYDKMIHCY